MLYIVAMVLCLCLIQPAMSSTEEEEKDAAQLKLEEFEAELGEEGMQEVEDYLALQASLPDVVKRMPYRALAFAATRPESQTVYMGYIDNFSVSEEEKERYKSGLQDVWDRYPFNITVYDYPFMAEIGPMIEEEAFSIYSPEELEAMQPVEVQSESELMNYLLVVCGTEEYLEIQKSLVEVVNLPYGLFAFVAYVPEGQVEVIRYIDNSNISEEMKEEYKNKIRGVWERYPNTTTTEDSQLMLELYSITKDVKLDEEDSNSSYLQSSEAEQMTIQGFAGATAVAVVLLCIYLFRKNN
ncbi:hypothetical protein [Methanolobus vulcani]|uniref:hypothetical protein n=1 Tax=Methanolobus vulcani TaxID=38026 RepID=UPI0018ACF08A|nr:hypothetical protein [Methanolobus vulcani]